MAEAEILQEERIVVTPELDKSEESELTDEEMGQLTEQMGPMTQLLEDESGEQVDLNMVDELTVEVGRILNLESREAQQTAYKEFAAQNPELRNFLAKLHELQQQLKTPLLEAKVQEEGNIAPETPNEQGEHLPFEQQKQVKEVEEQMVEKIADNLAKSLTADIVALIPQGAEWTDETAKELRERLKQASIPSSEANNLVNQIHSQREFISEATLLPMLEAAIARNKQEIAEKSTAMDEYKKLKEQLDGMDKDNVDYKKSYSDLLKKTDKIVDAIPMEDFIDLIFATGHGGGRSYLDRWSSGEEGGDEKERETMNVLREVFGDEQAAQLFFAELLQEDPSQVGENLIGKLDAVFAQLDSDDKQKKDDMRKKFSDAVSKASASPELFGKELKPDKVSLSNDVLKLVLLAAKKYTKE